MSPRVIGGDRTGLVVRYALGRRVVYLFVPSGAST